MTKKWLLLVFPLNQYSLQLVNQHGMHTGKPRGKDTMSGFMVHHAIHKGLRCLLELHQSTPKFFPLCNPEWHDLAHTSLAIQEEALVGLCVLV